MSMSFIQRIISGDMENVLEVFRLGFRVSQALRSDLTGKTLKTQHSAPSPPLVTYRPSIVAFCLCTW